MRSLGPKNIEKCYGQALLAKSLIALEGALDKIDLLAFRARSLLEMDHSATPQVGKIKIF